LSWKKRFVRTADVCDCAWYAKDRDTTLLFDAVDDRATLLFEVAANANRDAKVVENITENMSNTNNDNSVEFDVLFVAKNSEISIDRDTDNSLLRSYKYCKYCLLSACNLILVKSFLIKRNTIILSCFKRSLLCCD
jgi:hypothetical protein